MFPIVIIDFHRMFFSLLSMLTINYQIFKNIFFCVLQKEKKETHAGSKQVEDDK